MQVSTVYSLFQKTARQFGANPFLHIPAIACKNYSSGDIDYSYQSMLDQVDALSDVYRSALYGSGHRVALLLENRPEFFIHWLALNALGVSVVPLNGEMQSEEQAYILSHSDVCLLVVFPEKMDASAEVIDLMDSNKPALVSAESRSFPAAPQQSEVGEDPSLKSECAMLFTSGSTGQPKGCILSNEYFLELGNWYKNLGGLCTLEPGKERLLTPLPLVHMNAMAVSSIGMMATGGCLIQLDRFHPSTWWKTVKESGATALHYLGVLPAILLNIPESDDEKGLAVKFGFGAGVNPKHHQVFEDRFGFPLIESWAMSECGSGGCITAFEEPRHIGTSCFGVPDPQRVEYRLVDENDQDVAAGEPGELLVRRVGSDPRKGFFSGYYKNESATQEVWRDGWLHTGDVVRAGEDGALHFVDRRKNVIRRSGENIAALEVEAALVHCPLIEQVVVTAAPDDIRGDEVLAFVIPKEGVSPDDTAAKVVFDSAMDQLIFYKAPGYVVFVDSLPLTASQKPQRAEIKKLAVQVLSDLDNLDVTNIASGARVYDLRDQKRRKPST